MSSPRYHAYLHSTNEQLTLVASGSIDWVVDRMKKYLETNEPHSEDRVVIAEIVEQMDAGDWVMSQ